MAKKSLDRQGEQAGQVPGAAGKPVPVVRSSRAYMRKVRRLPDLFP